MRPIATGFLAACVALTISGCGESDAGGPPLTHDQFARRMKSICMTSNARLNGVNRGEPASVRRGQSAFDRRWVATARDALNEIQRLNPPKRDEKRLDQAFAHWSRANDRLQDLVHALETNKPREGNEAFRAMAAEVRAIDRLIPDYPAGDCWGPA